MPTNTVLGFGDRFYHPEGYPAPYGWSRTTGVRVTLAGKEGEWCEIVPSKGKFTFAQDQNNFFRRPDGRHVLIVSGFNNNNLNDRYILPISLLLSGDLDAIKVGMKEIGLPSCTRLNVLIDFMIWWHGTTVDR